jgi:hypothetical protein
MAVPVVNVAVTLTGAVPSCVPNPVVIPPGGQVQVQYILDLGSVQAGYYIAGFFDATPNTRGYLSGTPRVNDPAIPPAQAYAGYTITNTNIAPPAPPPNPSITIDIVLVIRNLQVQGITILYDPQDQDSQA